MPEKVEQTINRIRHHAEYGVCHKHELTSR